MRRFATASNFRRSGRNGSTLRREPETRSLIERTTRYVHVSTGVHQYARSFLAVPEPPMRTPTARNLPPSVDRNIPEAGQCQSGRQALEKYPLRRLSGSHQNSFSSLASLGGKAVSRQVNNLPRYCTQRDRQRILAASSIRLRGPT